MKKKYSAFSLIELSIVILIIGFLIAGVTQSSRLVALSKLRTAQTLTKSSPVASVDGLVLWLEPTLEESFAKGQAREGTKITQWNDLSPQSSFKYFAVNTDGSGPTYTKIAGPNGLPSLLFDNSLLTLATDFEGNEKVAINTEDNAFSYFIVSARSNENINDFYALTNNAPYFWAYRVYVNDRKISNPTSVEFPTKCLKDLEIFSVAFSGTATSPNEIHAYVNGGAASNNGENTLPMNYGASNKLYIGGYSENTALWAGHISEIIIFNRELEDEERQSIEKYLGKKYGIKISS